MINRKQILCLDFDGVLHSYSSGWKGADVIPDAPVPGAMLFLSRAVEDFTVAVFSSRSNQPYGIEAMQVWIKVNLLREIEDENLVKHIYDKIEWPKEKPPALLTIDDRAICFDGSWPKIEDIHAFKPWNKK